MTEERLRDIFSDCGAIEDAIVQRHSQVISEEKFFFVVESDPVALIELVEAERLWFHFL